MNLPEINSLTQNFLHFRDPWFLLLFITLPVWFYFEYGRKQPSMTYPSLRHLKRIRPGWRVRLSPALKWLRLASLCLLIFGMARFQYGRKSIEVITHGVDIILAIDTSGSMKGEDFHLEGQRATRLKAVKSVVEMFVKSRTSDRLGMVVFGTMAFTQCPLTLDHGVTLSFLKNLEIGMAGENTAIGDALGTAINRLKNLKSKTKIIILLTDGDNTHGVMDPEQAAEIAATFGIKVYTIGVGSKGEVPFLVQTIFGPRYQYVKSDLNEDLLRKIATETGGKYYRAQDTEQLQQIYEEIDGLEKTKSKIKEHMEFRELFHWFVIPGLLLLGLEKLLEMTVFRRTP
mgnify:FL=1